MKPTPFMGPRHDLVSVSPGDPGAGALLSWPVPTKAVIQVVAVKVHLTTCGTAGDRIVVVYVIDGGVIAPTTPAAIVQIASKAWTYYFTIGIAPLDYTSEASEVYQPLGCCYQLETGSSLIINVKNIEPTDQLAAAAIRYFLWEQA